MKLSKVKLQGYRNFKKATINFVEKSLVIGANDVGKTNLLWAIRLLLDRKLNDFDIEPKDSDFYAHEETDFFEIILMFEDVTEDCVVAKLKGKISDDDKLFLAYRAYRDGDTMAKSFKLFAGKSVPDLEEIEDRYYRKVLNVQYLSSRRDFHHYINREKNHLFQLAKANREPDEVIEDEKLLKELKDDLQTIDGKIPNLNYIGTATQSINEELLKLSEHNKNQEVVFDTNASDVNEFISSVSIASSTNGKLVKIGGDGRLNQIYLALWASRNELNEDKIEEVTIVCIEEPEAHLHPHQQRKLVEYLNTTIKGQVILTSHSPQILSEFSPNSIIRLYVNRNKTKAASNGCSEIIEDAFDDFGFRMSIIPAEAFFADVVFLVEGPSEELFYKTLANQIGVDLDRLNISVLMVDGIGFKPFIRILDSLNITWVLRTDNDIQKIPKKEEFRCAGIQRCIGFYREFFSEDEATDKVLAENENRITNLSSKELGEESQKSADNIIKELNDYDMYISKIDLENDLANGPLSKDLAAFFEGATTEKIVAAMQKRKATFMYNFLKKEKEKLVKLAEDAVAAPLLQCKVLAEEVNDGTD